MAFFSLSGFETLFLFNLFLALIVGYIMGSERKIKGKPAGASTYTLVVAGSMLFTFLSAHVDPFSRSRIAAQVITGIGFLGAGLILRVGGQSKVENLTTAASIWYAAAVGMAIGFGYHLIAILAAIADVIIARIPNVPKIQRMINRRKKS